MATLLLPAPRFDWLLPATAAAQPDRQSLTIPDFSLILRLGQPIVTPKESPEEVAETYKDFLEMAYRRDLQTPREYFRVAQWYRGPDQRGPREVHAHKRVADKMVMAGLFEPNPTNNGSRCKYRISDAGIAYVEDSLDRWNDLWRKLSTFDGDLWLTRFNDYARQMAFDGWYILPEPGRSWQFEQAFVHRKEGWRQLHRIKWVGWPDGHGWQQHERYFYTTEGYNFRETAAFAQFKQPIRMDIPF